MAQITITLDEESKDLLDHINLKLKINNQSSTVRQALQGYYKMLLEKEMIEPMKEV